MMQRRFKVALSFPGEHRNYVERVAECLSQSLGRSKVFYDKYYEHELVGLNKDLYLSNVYKNDTDYVVVFFCKEYEKKPWCNNLEWRSIRAMILGGRSDAIIPLKINECIISGLLETDICIYTSGRSPKDISNLIIKKVNGGGPNKLIPDTREMKEAETFFQSGMNHELRGAFINAASSYWQSYKLFYKNLGERHSNTKRAKAAYNRSRGKKTYIRPGNRKRRTNP